MHDAITLGVRPRSVYGSGPMIVELGLGLSMEYGPMMKEATGLVKRSLQGSVCACSAKSSPYLSKGRLQYRAMHDEDSVPQLVFFDALNSDVTKYD